MAQYWKEHYDLRYYMEKNWYTLGPKLQGKMHVFVGDADNFFLNNAVHLMQNWMVTTKDPHYEGFFVYGAMRGHCYTGPGTTADRLREMAQYVLGKMPPETVAQWWGR